MDKRKVGLKGLATVATALVVAVLVWFWFVSGRSADGNSVAMTKTSPVNADQDDKPTLAASTDGRSAADAPSQQPANTTTAVVRITAPLPHPAAVPTGTGNGLTAQINAATRTPTADLALRAAIARRHNGIPPQVDELIRRRHAGASPKELEEWLRDHPIKDIGTRVDVLQWIHGNTADN
jgi:hypothetical protein